MKKVNLKAVVWKEGKVYISRCLDVEVSSFGKTRKEAMDMLQDALNLYFEDQPLPQKLVIKNPILTSVELQYA